MKKQIALTAAAAIVLVAGAATVAQAAASSESSPAPVTTVLLTQRGGAPLEIIVSANGCTDRTAQIAAERGVTVVDRLSHRDDPRARRRWPAGRAREGPAGRISMSETLPSSKLSSISRRRDTPSRTWRNSASVIQ